MSLIVDIEKKLGSFTLHSKFETGSGTMALLGASGCGKSVTLRCIAGIMMPDRGRIVLDGQTLFDSEKRIDLTLPLRTEEEQVTVAIPDSAVTLHTGPYRAVVSRVIHDLDASIVLLHPEHLPDAPLLRASLPKHADAKPGQPVTFALRPESCLCYPTAQPLPVPPMPST